MKKFEVSFDFQAARVAKELAGIGKAISGMLGFATKESSKTGASIARDFSKAASSVAGDAGKMASSMSNSMNSIARDSSRTASSIARDFASISKTMQGGFSTSGWIKGGIGLGIGNDIYQGLKSAVMAPGRMMGQWLSDSMELTAVSRKFDIVFGATRASANKFAKDLANEINGSMTDIKAQMARFQDTFVPMGFSRGKAYEMSQKATRLAIDLAASEPGMTQGEAATRINSAMVGNHEAVRIFGVMLGEATLKQELLNMGVKGGIEKATEQEKSLARLNIILKGTSDAHGSAARAQGDLRQQLGGLSAVWTEVSARMGQIFAPAAAKVVEFFKTMGVSLNSALGPAEQWGKVLGDAVSVVVVKLKPVQENFKRLSDGFGYFVEQISNGAANIAKAWDSGNFYKSMADVFGKGADLVQPFIVEIQQGILLAFGGISGALLGLFGNTGETIKAMMTGFMDSIYASIKGIEDAAYGLGRLTPGTNAFAQDQELYGLQKKRDSEFARIDAAFPVKDFNASTMSERDSDNIDRRESERKLVNERLAKEAEEIKKKYGFGAASAGVDSARKALAGAGSGTGNTMVDAFARMSEGFKAGMEGMRGSSMFKDMEGTRSAAAAKASDTKIVRGQSLGEQAMGFLNRSKEAMGDLSKFFGIQSDESKIDPVKKDSRSKALQDIDKKIAGAEKNLKSVSQSKNQVEFTTSEGLAQKMATAFSGKDTDQQQIKLAEKQVQALREQREKMEQQIKVAKETPAMIAQAIRKVMGYQ